MGIDFEKFVMEVCVRLEEYAKADPKRIAACNTGEKFEECVVQATQEAVDEKYAGAKVEYLPGSHAFPDIVVIFQSGERYGIEVKSSSSATSKGWKINGNSILGSTKQDVLDTYIVFGKTAMRHQEFRYKRYEDAVANVVVTHSPRYSIDMDLLPGETFFEKSGLSYQEISQSPNPIQLVTDYFKKQGLSAWWLVESAPAALRLFGDLNPTEQAELLGYCFAHFPEVFSNGMKKFYRTAVWLAVEQSVLAPSLRDSFTAGGQVDIAPFGRVPRIFDNVRVYKPYIEKALNDVSMEQLCEDWGMAYESRSQGIDKIAAWCAVAAAHCHPDRSADYHPGYLLNHIMEIK